MKKNLNLSLLLKRLIIIVIIIVKDSLSTMKMVVLKPYQKTLISISLSICHSIHPMQFHQ